MYIYPRSEDTESAVLGAAIDEMVEMSNDQYIPGSQRIMLVVSTDGTSK